MNKALSLAALALALIALATALTRPSPAPPVSAPAPDPELRQKLSRVESELSQARGTIADLRQKIDQLEQRAASSAQAASPDAALAARVAALEQQSRELTRFTNEFDRYGIVSSMEAELLNAYSTLMDTNRPAGERLKQVASLKRYRYFDEKALRAVADIYLQTDNFGEKGLALAALRGTVPSPEFRDRILADLSAEAEQGNQSARFRYFAIEALEPLRDDPAVQQWLAHLAQNDPMPKLAARAGQALGIPPQKPAR